MLVGRPVKKKQVQVGDVILIARSYYVVERAQMEGGGTGMGPGDVYPDGWHVTARKLAVAARYPLNLQYAPGGKLIDFYQSGCFTNMRGTVVAVGKMMRVFV